MKSLFITVFALVFCSISVHASHIVGGEFEIEHLYDSTYSIRLIQYFDEINGNPNAKDSYANIYIYRKKDNAFMESVILNLSGQENVNYSIPSCADGNLKTSKLIYSARVTLRPSVYGSSEGYYLVYERCCRNYVITNINKPEETGQTFYLEFGPVSKNGAFFKNSSPQLFPPLSDYACVGRLYYVDFRGKDPDGDSLVYSLAPPLNSSRFEALPIPSPAPHREVEWVNGITSSIQVPGNPSLKINSNGLLTVKPSEMGLFVFSVKVEEFRNKVKIGEVRRDFQLYVIDCPPPGKKPQLTAEMPGTGIRSKDDLYLEFDKDDDKCISFQVTDNEGAQRLQFKAVPVNFNYDLSPFLSKVSEYISNGDTATFELCLPECPLNSEQPVIMDVIAMDYTCPQPLMDTIRITINQTGQKNRYPQFTNSTKRFVVKEGEGFSSTIEAIDGDGDFMEWSVLDEEELKKYGFAFSQSVNEAGRLKIDIAWDAECDKYPFGLKNIFPVVFTAKDKTNCPDSGSDTLLYVFEVQLPENSKPNVTIEDFETNVNTFLYLGNSIKYNIKVRDNDSEDQVRLYARGNGFTLGQLGMNFEEKEGKSFLQSEFSWQQLCSSELIFQRDTFSIYFVAEDKDICQQRSTDSVRLFIKVAIPENKPPGIYLNQSEVPDTFNITAGGELNFEVTAVDPEKDSIYVELQNREQVDLEGIKFEDRKAISRVTIPFKWNSSCKLLSDGFQPNLYSLTFAVRDKGCAVSLYDSLTVWVRVKDLETNSDFMVANVITPGNDDDKNDFFYVPGISEDNCRSRFLKVEIYNRWGTRVFESRDRNFKWYARDEASGVYFYAISFTNRIIKGELSVLK